MEEINEALALKYRPMDFDELVGQEAVSKTLSLALNSKRLSHAYLFSGLRGSGKTSSARIFARALQCDEGPRAKPCGVCENCIAANPHKMRHIDIIELDGASSRKIDDIRDLIEQTKYHPSMGRFKIFIIDEVHMLTKEAFNALLKTLEEPPSYVKFILATTDPLKLPATILSRTQHFRFKRISEKSILEHLKMILQKEGVEYQEEALNMLIRSGSGSLRDTLTLLDQAIIYSNYNITQNVCANMLGLINPQSLNELMDAVFREDKEEILQKIEGFFEYECEMLLDELSIFLKEKLIQGNDERFNTMIIDRFLRILAQAKQLLFLGSEDSFVLTLSVFKMLEALKVKKIDKMIEELQKGVYEELPHSVKMPLNTVSSQNENIQTNKITQQQKPKEELSNPLNNAKELFSLLVQKLYERSYDLGKCFEDNIEFISFESGELTWASSAKDEAKERLRNAYSVIKGCVFDIFGLQTQIKAVPKEIKAQNENIEAQKIPQKETDENKAIEATKNESSLQEASFLQEDLQVTQDLENLQTKEDKEEQKEIATPQEELKSIPQEAKNTVQQEVNEALELPLLQSAKTMLGIKQIKVRPRSDLNGN
ncbi:DNA polymerase III subunit gamma/tau [Helicobacter valdiviensis]|uniref:DNA polymerase III subunit gamma/tau n=1 Tax=Helicobacter valdiviensis TaxID=1458358 RepID=A0A2W6MVE2_9HELI|nr:DNA polymerase III subunit gamma/tau [Helicobacter valdiviensis]PZT47931.1 DNA polymerase III subunit gamma/tau [Helicobacter valdiviensis]